jgi:required for meiotic nuclear division protein 1
VPCRKALYCELDGSASVFFFHDGSLVCWQATEGQIERCRYDARSAQDEPYGAGAVETEEMNYVHKRDGCVQRAAGTADKVATGVSPLWAGLPRGRRHTGMVAETIVLGGEVEEELVRERLAFSNGLARSAKLAVLESQLETYLERHRHLPQLMKVPPHAPARLACRVGRS